ncbi:MAG: RND transporter, partial [Polaromonas sp.]
MKKFDAPRRAPDRPALRSLRPFWSLCALCLAGCAVQPPAAPVAVAIAPQWQAPLPAGSSTTALPHQGSLS